MEEKKQEIKKVKLRTKRLMGTEINIGHEGGRKRGTEGGRKRGTERGKKGGKD